MQQQRFFNQAILLLEVILASGDRNKQIKVSNTIILHFISVHFIES
jgi:hypothetical protein